MSIVGFVKGRGYFVGVKFQPTVKKKTKEQYNEELQEWMKQKFRWGNGPSKTYQDGGKWGVTCKRNLSDVPKEFIFDSEDDLQDKIDYFKKEYHEESPIDFSGIEVQEYDENTREKRVIKSKKKTHHAKNLMKIHPTGSGDTFCGNCGTNIYTDEPRLISPYLTICIHCLNNLGEDIIDHYEKVPEKYKEDYLLARSVEI